MISVPAAFQNMLPNFWHNFRVHYLKVALSPGVREIYEEALRTPGLSLEKDNIDSHQGRPVTDVIDTVLSCARMVRTATTFSDGIQQARRSWISLLSLLGFAISEDIFILYVFYLLAYFLFKVYSAKMCHFFCLKRRKNRQFMKAMNSRERLLSSCRPSFPVVFENMGVSSWTNLLLTTLVSDESSAAPEYGVDHAVISKQLVGCFNANLTNPT